MDMERFTDYGYSGIDNGTKVSHFLQGIKINELEAAVNNVPDQPEKHDTDFDAMVSYLGQMAMEKGASMQSTCIAKTRDSASEA